MKIMKFIKDMFTSVLNFLSLLDNAGNLSITNILLIGLSIKLILTSNADYASGLALTTAIVNYAHKRHLIHKRSVDLNHINDTVSSNTQEISKVSNKLTAIEQTMALNSRTRNM